MTKFSCACDVLDKNPKSALKCMVLTGQKVDGFDRGRGLKMGVRHWSVLLARRMSSLLSLRIPRLIITQYWTDTDVLLITEFCVG